MKGDPTAQTRQTATAALEHALGDAARAWLPAPVAGFALFVLKQLWAALFGLLILAGLILTDAIWQDGWSLARYDALVIYAVTLQVLFLAFRLETWAEARVILLFHLTGTVMEWFKVSAGSWAYPEASLLKVFGVPLFTGFMYASVGSYIARVVRIFGLVFAPYPPLWLTFALAGAIYVNFFSHHFLPDIRLALFAATILIYGRTRIWTVQTARPRWVPLPLAALFGAFALWVAENVGTGTGTWAYAGQGALDWVSLSKLGSWYLLIYVSFVTVTLVSREALLSAPFRPSLATTPAGSPPSRSPAR
ncbi:DUF817 domain-containing protein [Pseudaestuariivita atlantica]|uniref:Membrane protein n=1 Tax=Pseudaestuariivita atlantica TaxID=1317121 RepID=A0A0L1JUV4_9RHOB|nr:DUF817 domain-containing protein [Pseudaestuariivita atlantica]KNG95188.1 membrane protein [Pseudaestuariivita atlantica]